LMEFYNVLKWDYPNANWEAAANFFEF